MFLWLFFLGGVLLKEDCFPAVYMEKFPSLCWFYQFLFFVGLDWWKCVFVMDYLGFSIYGDSFSMYTSLGCHLCSLKVCIKPFKDLLAFIVCGEKTGVIMIGLILYIIWLFSYCFNILSLFITFGVFNTIDRRNFLSGPVCLGFCMLLVCSWASLSLG